METYEFMSPDWIEMARREITRALAGQDLHDIRYAMCEEFTHPPEHLRSTAGTAGFFIRIADGQVEVGDHPIDGADLKIVSDYTDALEVARDPDAPAADPSVVQERLASGRLRIEGNPSGMPPVLMEANIHRLLAPHTA